MEHARFGTAQFCTVCDCLIRPAGPKEAVLGPFGAGFSTRRQFLAHRRVVTAALAHRETQEPRQVSWLCLVILEDSQHEHRDSATPEALPPRAPAQPRALCAIIASAQRASARAMH